MNAILNSGAREDSTRIGRGGTVRRQAVDVSPLRRVNQAIYLLCTGAREAAFRNVKTIAECLADELLNAAKVSSAVEHIDSLTGQFKLLRHQKERRIGASCEVQPVKLANNILGFSVGVLIIVDGEGTALLARLCLSCYFRKLRIPLAISGPQNLNLNCDGHNHALMTIFKPFA